MKLLGKKALITGASKGIGKAIAFELAREGADVIINYNKNLEKAKEVSDKINSMGRKSLIIKADVSDNDSVSRMINETIKAFNRIDILINNAGIAKRASIEDVSLEDWDRVMNVNLRGAFLCCKMAGKQMIRQGEGNIINIASISGIMPDINLGAYSVSKSGLIMLTRLLSIEWAKYNIRVNSVCPGPIETQLMNEVFRTPELLKARLESMPLKRFGKPEEVAKLVAFLVSEDAGNITGENIVIDGGSLRSMFYLIDKLTTHTCTT